MRKEEIIRHLAEIEKEYNVRILYAAETGSRAWGFASPDSDWDVRFIYVHPLEWYLQVNSGRDVIEVMTDDGFDASGWDVRKAFSLYRKTNMTFMEWLNSPIVYIDNQKLREQLTDLFTSYFNVKRALYHFYHIAVNHQNRYLEKRGVELKRYLYYIRALLACQWILDNSSAPPVPFAELVNHTVKDESVLKDINHILALKSESKEHDKEMIPKSLHKFGVVLEEQILHRIDAYEEKKHHVDDGKLNELLYNIIARK